MRCVIESSVCKKVVLQKESSVMNFVVQDFMESIPLGAGLRGWGPPGAMHLLLQAADLVLRGPEARVSAL